MTFGQQVEFPAVVGFLDRDYRLLINNDAGLAPILLAEDQTRESCMRGSDSTSAAERRTKPNMNEQLASIEVMRTSTIIPTLPTRNLIF